MKFCVLSLRVSFTASCVMDLRSFPHDSQTCHLKFGSCKYRTITSIILFITMIQPHSYVTPYHLTLFRSIPDAYDDSDVIFKWQNADVHVSRDNMAQFQFLGARFTSDQDSYLNGKNKVIQTRESSVPSVAFKLLS